MCVDCVRSAIGTRPADQSYCSYSNAAEQSTSPALWMSLWHPQPRCESVSHVASDWRWQRQRCSCVQTANLWPSLCWRGISSRSASHALLVTAAYRLFYILGFPTQVYRKALINAAGLFYTHSLISHMPQQKCITPVKLYWNFVCLLWCIMGIISKAGNNWRDVGQPQVAMHCNCHIF